MTYAHGRTCYDADSHIMELPDFLAEYADADTRERLPRIKVPRVGRLATLVEEAERNRKHSDSEVAELLALGDKLIGGPKGYMALGAFNAAERAQALDLLGFARQLVFATFSEGLAFSLERTIEERYAAARAHNRAMADFCGSVSKRCGSHIVRPAADRRATTISIRSGRGSPKPGCRSCCTSRACRCRSMRRG
jgi:hypothetical protein